MGKRARADHDAGLYPACRACGSTGGKWCGGTRTRRVYRKRGLCGACYDYNKARGTHTDFPLIPTTGWGHVHPEHPAIPTGFVHPWQVGITPEQHAVLPGGNELAAWLVAEAEAFAAAYLASKALGAA